MKKLVALGMVIAAIGAGALMASSSALAQLDGALQYPPASAGEDAQPPPPAGMVLQSVSPRRIELGVSGSSQPPVASPSRLRPWTDTGRLPIQAAPTRGLPPNPSSSAAGN